MYEEFEQFCNNCKKYVGTANFASHSSFCQRNIRICKVCDEPIPRNSVKEHEEEYHISVICDMCETSIKKWRLAKHQEEICPRRLVICEFCDVGIPLHELQEHIKFCGSRTEKCKICSRYIMFMHKKKHLEVHMHEENFRRENGAGKVHQSTINKIISKSSGKTSKSKYMHQNITDTSFSELCEKVKSRVSSEAYENLKSKYLYQYDDSQTRQKEKAGSGIEDVSSSGLEKSKENSTETCMNCGKKVPVHELSSHKEVCSKILKKQCQYCDKELHCDDSEENHLKNCAVYNHSISETQLLSKHFKDLFTNESCWDTVLQVGSKEFKVHRAILIARSSVFFAMFQHNTSEKQSGIVKIPDCDPDSFQQFLEYLYCGKLKHFSSDIALPLYTISDKYNVLELKTFCTKYLMKNITAQNMCEVAILADKFDETELFSATEKFFSKNFKEIVMTSEWESLMKKDFRLANKLLIGKAKVE